MENEQLIRQQMDDTRASISEKLETLETKVTGDIKGATGAVAETVEAVKDTVETVKDSVADSAEAVKEALKEGVESVKSWFDLPAHVQTHPWLVLGSAAAVGILLETVLVGGSSRDSGTFSQGAYDNASTPRDQYSGNGAAATPRRSGKSVIGSFFSGYSDQIGLLKDVAIGAIVSAVKDNVMKAVPTQRGPLNQFFDSITEKLKGNDASTSGGASGSSSPPSSQFDRARV